MGGSVDQRAPRGQMHLPATRSFDGFLEAPRFNPAAGKNFNPITRPFNQLLDQFHSLGHAIFLPAGQNARDSEVNQLFQSLEWIRGYIEGAVKYCLPLPNQLTDPPAPWNINASVRVQNTEHNTIRAVLHCSFC